MDDPGLDAREHELALRGLARLNRLGGAARIPFEAVRGLARESQEVRAGRRGPLTVLDLATGSADLPIAMVRRAQREGVQLSVRACDVSVRAIEAARARARAAGVEVDLFVADALGDDALPEADVVVSSLFLHHLDEAGAVRLLKRMGAAAMRMVVVNDLRRCAWGMALATAVPRLVTRSRVVHVDATRSVEAAFTMEELRGLARKAGLEGARVVARFPARMLLTWRANQ